MVVLDGGGDRPVPEFGEKTPLEAAYTPNLDALAGMGINGLLHPIATGIRTGSDTAHLSLFGYDPYEVYTGRGPFEAAGAGVMGKKGDVAFRCNFATVNEEGEITDRRAGRIRSGTDMLASALNGMEYNGIMMTVKEGTEHRAILLLHGDGLSAAVSDVDPHKARTHFLRCEPLDDSPEARRTAEAVNYFVEESWHILRNHEVNLMRERDGLPPANILLPRGGGVFPDIEEFGRKYGLRAAAITGVTLITGIVRLLGMNVIDVEGATGGIDSNFSAKLTAAVSALEKNHFVFVNLKAPDIAGHDGDAALKKEIFERIDAAFTVILGAMAERDDIILAVTSDHSTPVSVMDHSGDPVPLLIAGHGVRPDDVAEFGERAAMNGGLGHMNGRDLMPELLNLSGRAEKFGA